MTSGGRHEKLVPEGIEGRVPHKGRARRDGSPAGRRPSRRAWATAAAATIEALQAEAQLIRITQAGVRESHVHDVVITKEAPNYRVE